MLVSMPVESGDQVFLAIGSVKDAHGVAAPGLMVDRLGDWVEGVQVGFLV